jgi:hypothetical protein
MGPNARFVSAGMLAVAVACPFVTIGVLAIITRFRGANLRQALPWLRGLRWVAWLLGLMFILAALAYHRPYFQIGTSMAIASAGWGISEQWVKRRCAAE